MTPATSQSPKQIRKQIGPAVWLFALLVQFTPEDWTGNTPAYVANGNIVPDAELAARLAVSQGTISQWRRRLRAAGLIGWLVAPRQGRVFWIAGVPHALRPCCEPAPAQTVPYTVTHEILQAVQQRAISLTGKLLQDLSKEESARLAEVLAGGNGLPKKVPE